MFNNFKKLYMSFKINDLINYFYRTPKSYLINLIKYGGPIKIYLRNKGFNEMKEAAKKLKFVNSSSKTEINTTLNFLTGKKHWHLTSFCIYSLIRSSPNYKFKFRIFDDGSIDSKVKSYLEKIPNCEIILIETIESYIDLKLPRNKFPKIRSLRDNFFMMRKLTDIHLFDTNYNIYLDSDILFYSEPVELINWAKNPNCSFTIEDIYQSYGISYELMEKIVNNKNVPVKLNAGLYGINSNNIDFNMIEEWIEKTKHPKGFGNYYLEQAFTAMLVSLNNYYSAPKITYIVLPNKKQVENNIGVMHHYVDSSQNLYFTKAWRNILIEF